MSTPSPQLVPVRPLRETDLYAPVRDFFGSAGVHRPRGGPGLRCFRGEGRPGARSSPQRHHQRGTGLLRHCQGLLTKAEQTIRVLEAEAPRKTPSHDRLQPMDGRHPATHRIRPRGWFSDVLAVLGFLIFRNIFSVNDEKIYVRVKK